MAHIERRQQKRADGSRAPVKWRARHVDPDGNEHSKTFSSRTAAENWVAAQTTAIGTGDWVDPARGRITVKEWTESWLASVAPTLKPYTVASYRSLLTSRVQK